jgi:transcriptional regulator with XRE-family HTH domain
MLLTGDSETLTHMTAGKKEPTNELQRLFVQRLREEMGEDTENEISDNELARRSKGAISQTMISAIKRFAHDPSLEKVQAIAEALGVPAWFLMTPKDRVQQRVISPPIKESLQTTTTKVVELPPRYPKIFGKRNHHHQGGLKAKKTPIKK